MVEKKGSRKIRQSVRCPFCNVAACIECTQRVITDSIAAVPHCLFCKKEWLPDFFRTVFTQKFIDKELRVHREAICLRRAQADIPHLQDIIIQEKEREKNQTQARILKGNVNIHKHASVALYHRIKDSKKKGIDYTNLTAQRAKHMKAKRDAEEIYRKWFEATYINQPQKQKVVTEVKRKCPCDNCPGFLVKGVCGICDKWICIDCNTPREKEHTCDDDELATYKEICKGSKPCPNCGVRIIRTEGCPQMFCVECHTGFNWNTGAIDKGVIHNPHFFEWQRRNGAAAHPAHAHVNNGCAGTQMPNYISPQVSHDMHCILADYGHNQMMARGLRHRIDRFAHTTQDLGLRYLKGSLTEAEWKRRLFISERQRDFCTKQYELDTTIAQATEDIVLRFVAEARRNGFHHFESVPDETQKPLLDKIAKLFIVEHKKLVEYYIEQHEKLCKAYPIYGRNLRPNYWHKSYMSI
jgi:hypothetical protein